jgi:hypothetical protein
MQVDSEGDKPTFSADDLSHVSAPAEGADAGKPAGEGDKAPADKGAGGEADADKGVKGAGEKGKTEGGDGGKGGDADAGKPTEGDKSKEGEPAGDGEKTVEGEAKAAADKAAADAGKIGFPDDWRERILASLKLEGDALKKAQAYVKRMSGPADVFRSALAADGKIQEATDQVKGRPKLPTGKDDKPEDVAAFHKAWDVPKETKDYNIPDRPKELGERSEEDMGFIQPALDRFQKAHLNKAQVTEVLRVLDETELAVSRARAAHSKALDKDAEDTLRVEWGTPKDFDSNIEISNRVVERALGKYLPEQEDRSALLNLRMEDGRKLGSIPDFVRFLSDIGRNGFDPIVDDGSFVEAEPGGAGKDPAARMKEIAALMHTGKEADEAEYKRLQPEMQKLAQIVDRRKAGGRR